MSIGVVRIAFDKGAAPGKWFLRWRDRTHYGELDYHESYDAYAELVAGEINLALVRLPVGGVEGLSEATRERYHVVVLYEESPGIGFPKDSELALLDVITESDCSLVGAQVLGVFPDPDVGSRVPVKDVRDAVDIVAAHVGVVVAPRPLLRALGNRRIAHRDYVGGTPTLMALMWEKAQDCEAIQDFVGIAKGRRLGSSRGSQKPVPTRIVREASKSEKRRGRVQRKRRR